MNMKSILLGTAAGLMVSSAAMAADLPSDPAPAAVDYVKVCDAFGAGFFYIPGGDTCLKLSGEVSATMTYHSVADTVEYGVGGNVAFDARTATDYGMLRSVFKINAQEDATDTTFAGIDTAFIQLGYFTVGYVNDIGNSDVLYGENGDGYSFFDVKSGSANISVDDLGGGFYARAGISAVGADKGLKGFITSTDDLLVDAAFGIANQPWGSVDASFGYNFNIDDYAVKLTGDFIVAEGVNARLVAAYRDFGATDDITLGAAVKFKANEAASVYAGVSYDMPSVGADFYYVNAGVDYTVTPGLVATAEVDYTSATDNFDLVGKLTRSW